jgi:hypothetical protein
VGGISVNLAVPGAISAGRPLPRIATSRQFHRIFATLSFVDVKTLGIGLAFAVLIDATIVRVILMPAAMTLLGERSWYMPARLARSGRAASVRSERTAGPRR